ncbi:hypothetical protein D3C73_283930 [compost metagenome]
MRLSHKRKVAHKRSGAAKGWANVVRIRQLTRERIRSVAAEVVADWANGMNYVWECNVPGAVVFDEKTKPSLLSRFVNLVSSPFRRLKAAGEAQRNLLQGRR